MIDTVDVRLCDWVKTVIPDASVSLLPPGKIETYPCIGLYLLDLLNAPASHANRSIPLKFTLSYLITTWHEDPKSAHGLLGHLLVAASNHNDYEVDLKPVSPEIWRAFDVPPQPAFQLRAPLQIDRSEPLAKPVLSSVEITKRPLGSLTGLLVGPQDIPVVNAHIELMDCNAKTSTDNKGRFRFDSIPTDAQVKRLRIFTKGRTLMADTARQAVDSGPMLIRLNTLEE